MTELNPVTKVSQSNKEAPIGAKADNVYLYTENSTTHEDEYVGNLRDFYENWLDFKRNNNFSYTGRTDPAGIQQIKVWYQTYEPSRSDELEEENNG